MGKLDEVYKEIVRTIFATSQAWNYFKLKIKKIVGRHEDRPKVLNLQTPNHNQMILKTAQQEKNVQLRVQSSQKENFWAHHFECEKKFQTADSVTIHFKRPSFPVTILYKYVPYLLLTQDKSKTWHHLKATDNAMLVLKLSTLHNVISLRWIRGP